MNKLQLQAQLTYLRSCYYALALMPHKAQPLATAREQARLCLSECISSDTPDIARALLVAHKLHCTELHNQLELVRERLPAHSPLGRITSHTVEQARIELAKHITATRQAIEALYACQSTSL